MTSVTLNAPAKVNLFLKVLKKRKDGYHDIFTLFERISIADRIKISKIDNGIKVISDVPITAKPQDNLVYKAAEAIIERCRINCGVEIRIYKKTPIAAGLGGGSSDAAAVFLGMKRLFKLKITEKELIKMGEKLGADIPFFIKGDTFAFGTGKGSILRKSGIDLKLWHLIIYPGFKVPTKDIYGYFDKDNGLTNPGTDAKISPSFANASDFDALESMIHNDLESIVSSKYNVIANVIKRLAVLLGKKAIVSGSGPSIFCLYATRKEAIRARDKLLSVMSSAEKKSWRVFVAATL